MSFYGFQYGNGQYGGESTYPITDSSILGHQFGIVSPADAVGTPTPRTVWNQFDEHGLVVGLTRLKGEKNWQFRRRLFDVFIHRANSSYQGLVNGITRELGLSLFKPIQINPKVDSVTGEFLAPDPYIKFDGVWLYLYSDYKNDVLDYKIDRFEPGGNYEHLIRLANFINKTIYFEAAIEPDIDEYTRSMTIVNQSNRERIQQDLPISTKFKLNYDRIVNGSVIFSDLTIFRTEVFTEVEVTSMGKYYINYHSGIVTVFSPPPLGAVAIYDYSVYPFKPWASPIILHDINNDNFKVKMFEQMLLDDGTYAHGLPTELGVDIINEILSVSALYNGV